MEAKHTPGPWAQHPSYPWLIKQDSRPIAEIEDGVTVCGTNSHEDSGFFPTPDEGRANARLIAAAPELLEACKEMLSEMCVWEDHLGLHPAAEKARAAIAKATGVQQ